MWKKTTISAAATFANMMAACVHCYLPLKYWLAFCVTGGFLVESELGRWTGRLSRAKALYTQVTCLHRLEAYGMHGRGCYAVTIDVHCVLGSVLTSPTSSPSPSSWRTPSPAPAPIPPTLDQRVQRMKEYKKSGKEVDATAKRMADAFIAIAQDKARRIKTQYTVSSDHEMIANTFATIDDSGDNEIDTEELEQALAKLNDGDEKYPAKHLMTIFDKEVRFVTFPGRYPLFDIRANTGFACTRRWLAPRP